MRSAFFYLIFFIGFLGSSLGASEKAWEWISDNKDTWYDDKIFNIRYESLEDRERLVVPVSGLRVGFQAYPRRLSVDYIFKSRLNSFSFPTIKNSRFIRYVRPSFYANEYTSRFQVFLAPHTLYKLKRLMNPDRLVIELFADPTMTGSNKVNYFIQSQQSYSDLDAAAFLRELGVLEVREERYRIDLSDTESTYGYSYPVSDNVNLIWIGPFASAASANVKRQEIYDNYIASKERDELLAFKQYLAYHVIPGQQAGFDVKNLRKEFNERYRAEQSRRIGWDETFRQLYEASDVVAY